MTFNREFVLSMLVILGVGSAQENQSSIQGRVPDESVLGQWAATLPVILEARQNYFERYKVPARSHSGPLSDDELINGRKPDTQTVTWAPVPALEGAEDCRIFEAIKGDPVYECSFLPLGKSASDMQAAFVKLVRLVEKAARGTATLGAAKPWITPQEESRIVNICTPGEGTMFPELCKITVWETWSAEGSEVSRLAEKNRDKQHPSRVYVQIGAPPRDPGTSGTSLGIPIQLARSSNPTGANPVITVNNSSDSSWEISFTGPKSLTISLPPHGSQSVTLNPGNYFISASTPDPRVVAFAPFSYQLPTDVVGTFTITAR